MQRRGLNAWLGCRGRVAVITVMAVLVPSILPGPTASAEVGTPPIEDGVGDAVPGPGSVRGLAPDDRVADLADVVVIGEVHPRARAVDGTEDFPVDTLYPVSVRRTVKGEPGDRVMVRIHGGHVEPDLFLTVSTEPSLMTDDVAVFFLTEEDDGTFRPVQGVPSVIFRDLKVQHTTFRNPLFDLDPRLLLVEDACAPNPPAQSGYSGFVLSTNSSGAHMVWSGSSYSYVVNSGISSFHSSINAAAATWNGSGMAFTVNDGGTTSLSGVSSDGANVISGASNSSSPSTIASTSTWSFSDGRIAEVDIVFNTYNSFSSSPSSSQYDTQSVALHEFGHSLGLGHITDSAQVMYGCISAGEIKRSLGWGDVAGAKNFYPPNAQGYYLLDESGALYTLGGYGSWFKNNAPYLGAPNQGNVINYPTHRAVAIEIFRPTRYGYWILATNGGVFTYGDAPFFGSAAGLICGSCTAVAMASTPTGLGYWILDSNGGLYSFGDAIYHGNGFGLIGAGDARGLSAPPNGNGYWMVNGPGSIFSFGLVNYHGGGIPVGARPARALQSSAGGSGYWILGSNGGVYAFGDAPALGSAPVASVNFSRHPTFNGYTVIASAGAIYNFNTHNYGRGTTATPYTAVGQTDRPVI